MEGVLLWDCAQLEFCPSANYDLTLCLVVERPYLFTKLKFTIPLMRHIKPESIIRVILYYI